MSVALVAWDPSVIRDVWGNSQAGIAGPVAPVQRASLATLVARGHIYRLVMVAVRFVMT